MNVVEFTFGSSDQTLKKQIEEKEANIADLNQKLLENRKVQHLGCESEIQNLKSQIKALQEKPIPKAESILYTPGDTDLRAQEIENEVKQFRRKLAEVQSELNLTKDDLKRKENEHSKKYQNNIQMLKKCLDEKDRLQTKLINFANKVKEQEKELQHMVVAASLGLEDSEKGKRSYSQFSSSKEEELQKPPKQPRVLQ